MGSSYDPELEGDPTGQRRWPQSAPDGEPGQPGDSAQACEHPELLAGNEIEARHAAGRQTSCGQSPDCRPGDLGEGPLQQHLEASEVGESPP